MAVHALVAVGLLGDGFMSYALFHWMRDSVRNRRREAPGIFLQASKKIVSVNPVAPSETSKGSKV
jgi:hypothetical protein